MVCVHAFIAANGFVQYGDAVCGPVRQWVYGSTVMRCVVQCGSGCMAVRWCGVWSSAAVGVWTGRSLYVGWLCQPKREGGRAETGEREGSVFTSAKKAYYKRDERKSDLLSRERTFTSPGPWPRYLSGSFARLGVTTTLASIGTV